MSSSYNMRTLYIYTCRHTYVSTYTHTQAYIPYTHTQLHAYIHMHKRVKANNKRHIFATSIRTLVESNDLNCLFQNVQTQTPVFSQKCIYSYAWTLTSQSHLLDYTIPVTEIINPIFAALLDIYSTISKDCSDFQKNHYSRIPSTTLRVTQRI